MDHAVAEAWADDEVGTGIHGLVDLLRGPHAAGTGQHVRALGEGAHGVQRVGRAQRHLDPRKTSFHQRVGEGRHQRHRLDDDDRDEAARSRGACWSCSPDSPINRCASALTRRRAGRPSRALTSPLRESPGQLEDFDAGRRWRPRARGREEPRQVQQGGSRTLGRGPVDRGPQRAPGGQDGVVDGEGRRPGDHARDPGGEHLGVGTTVGAPSRRTWSPSSPAWTVRPHQAGRRPISRHTSTTLRLFGPQRLMYGGDWPFALLASRNYRQVWDGIQGTIASLEREDRRALLGDTARRVYGLTDSG